MYISWEKYKSNRKYKKILKKYPNACTIGFKEDENTFRNNKYINVGKKEDLREIAKNIFTALRKVDKLKVDVAIIEGVEKEGLGLSIMNRLVRACENNIIS